jgi:GH15 family glucan-1,4-alpha-glucosidase
LCCLKIREASSGSGGQWLTLGCRGVELEPGSAGELRGRLRLSTGQRQWLVLTCAPDAAQAEQALAPTAYEQLLAETLDYWRCWAEECTYRGPYRAQVVRSALVLKLLTYEPTGAVVAAPTTSLPEHLGGERNWDYRYTWLRDSSLILYALMTLGYVGEGADFRHWLEDTVGSDLTASPQIMYGIDGRRELPEQLLDHLGGYRGSRPVRIGNAAAGQRQLDIYGAVLRSAALHYQLSGGEPSGGSERRASPSPGDWQVLRALVEQVTEHWVEPDRGIWEVRGGSQHFLYSKLMCWSALDVGIRLAEEHGLVAPLRRWRRSRAQIRSAILDQGYDRGLGAFVQAFGSSTLDASALMIPRVGFLAPIDPRLRSTVARIQQELTRDGLVYRYRAPDGLPGDEGTFTLCSFWLAEALALAGQVDQANALFEQVLVRANDLGLLAEEIDPATGEQLGNFPQGFSHLALIGAAVDLAAATEHGAERRALTEAERASRASRSASVSPPPRRD